jgi:catechol 2,3-dioxygenase-like lactoylglutathione lyase family enzyme
MKTNLAHVKVMVKDIEKSLKWYTEILGFEVDSCYPETNPVYYDFKSDGGACFAIGFDENMTPNGRFNFKCGDTDALWEKLKDKVTVIEPIWDTPWGTRKFTIADPDGNELGF